MTDCTEIVRVLGEIYELEEIDQWFDSVQACLGGKTPTKAIADGEYDKVLQIAQSATDGVFL